MTGTRPSQWIGDAAGTLTMIWERFSDNIADVPVVSPTSQSRLEMFNSVQLLIMSPMHRRHVPVDAGTSPSLTTIWKPDFTLYHKIPVFCIKLSLSFSKAVEKSVWDQCREPA